MAINIPPAVNYPSPLNAVPTNYGKTPNEGAKLITCEIDWGTMGGASNNVQINLQNNATLNFSQIVALSIDNSQCGADVQFVFPDTVETLTVPAYTPKLIVEVFTNQTQFFVYAQNAQSEDVTKFSIHNSLPPVIAVPTTQEQNVAASGNIDGSVVNTPVQLVPSNVSGTLEDIQVMWNAGALSSSTFVIRDTEKIIFTSQAAGGTNNPTAGEGGQFSIPVLSFSDIRVRFQGGLQFLVTSATASPPVQTYNVNLLYRTP